MWKLFLCFLILSTINLGQVAGYCSTSESNAIYSCYGSYFHSLGVYTYDYDTFDDQYNDYMKTWSGVETVCSAFSYLKNCLGIAVINDCMNTQGFYQSGIPSYFSETGYYLANYFLTDFTCGKGKAAYENAFYCLNQIGTYCTVQSSTCSDVINTIDCLSTDARKGCGQDGYYYFYNSLSIDYCYIKPECNTCIDGQSFPYSTTLIFSQDGTERPPGHHHGDAASKSLSVFFIIASILSAILF